MIYILIGVVGVMTALINLRRKKRRSKESNWNEKFERFDKAYLADEATPFYSPDKAATTQARRDAAADCMRKG